MKSVTLTCGLKHIASPPSRGAWIEMSAIIWNEAISIVAPLAGGVD